MFCFDLVGVIVLGIVNVTATVLVVVRNIVSGVIYLLLLFWCLLLLLRILFVMVVGAT